VPATIAMLEGRIHVGLNESELEAVATRDDVVKTSIRDLATVAARKGFAATTVAATSHLANLVGIRVFATGGLGGVHRHARESWDESADLTALSQIPITIVCSGVKSILDVGATLERLETLNVGVVVFGSQEFPGFYLSESGFTVDWSLDDPADIADVMATRRQLDITSGLVIAHPLPHASQLDPDLHDQVLTEGLKLADSKTIAGKDVTPFLLDHFSSGNTWAKSGCQHRDHRSQCRTCCPNFSCGLTRFFPGLITHVEAIGSRPWRPHGGYSLRNRKSRSPHSCSWQ